MFVDTSMYAYFTKIWIGAISGTNLLHKYIQTIEMAKTKELLMKELSKDKGNESTKICGFQIAD